MFLSDSSPDWNYVREQEHESNEIQPPGTGKAFHADHRERQRHDKHEQYFSEVVDFEVE
jgi:hypothetical protein